MLHEAALLEAPLILQLSAYWKYQGVKKYARALNLEMFTVGQVAAPPNWRRNLARRSCFVSET